MMKMFIETVSATQRACETLTPCTAHNIGATALWKKIVAFERAVYFADHGMHAPYVPVHALHEIVAQRIRAVEDAMYGDTTDECKSDCIVRGDVSAQYYALRKDVVPMFMASRDVDVVARMYSNDEPTMLSSSEEEQLNKIPWAV